MNYKKHYNLLIERAKNRQIEGYKENHHIIPKCMGGSDDKDNLVALTPEEHYIAHQLLVKIYPKNNALVKAANMMIPNRPSNKLYGWIRKRMSSVMSESQLGEKNSQYETFWVHNKKIKKSKKVKKGYELEDGWELGRIINFDKEKKRTKEEYAIERIEEARKLAYDLYYQFMKSDFNSITSFAKSINSSQPRLTMLWKEYVIEYNSTKKHGKSYKKI